MKSRKGNLTINALEKIPEIFIVVEDEIEKMVGETNSRTNMAERCEMTRFSMMGKHMR